MLHLDVAGLRTPDSEHAPEFAANGDPVLSPSQVTTFALCPRKWAARYIHGQKEPVGSGTAAGTRMHKILADYYNKGLVPRPEVPEGTWALALISKGDLPIPGAPVAERRFKFEHDGVWWRGAKDLVYDRDGWRIIRDHKSTSSLQWAKTTEDLRTDPQSVIYALDEYRGAITSVVNEWGYVTRTKYPEVLVVRTEMPVSSVQEAMATYTAVGKLILSLYRERPLINDLPPNGTVTGGCEAFGGCKVVGCNVTAIDRIKGLQVSNARRMNMGYLDDLRAKQAVKAVTTLADAPVAETPTVRERLAAVVPPPYVPPADDTPAEPSRPFVPPPYTGMPPWVAGPAATPPAAAGGNPATPTAGGAPPRTRGRKRAAEGPIPGGTPRVLDLTHETPTPPRRNEAIPAPVIGWLDGYTLCVNCSPAGRDGVLFSQWVAPVHAALVDKTPHYPLMGFDGTALYQDALRQAIEQTPPQGYLIVDSRTNEGRDALAILERNATVVIRGF